MKNAIFTLVLMMSLAAAICAQRDLFEQGYTPSSILKPMLTVRCARDLNYWKQPALKNFWSWMPKVQFTVSGPIDDASYLTYEFFKPDGKLWYSLDSAPFAIAEGGILRFESEAVPRWTDPRSTIETVIPDGVVNRWRTSFFFLGTLSERLFLHDREL